MKIAINKCYGAFRIPDSWVEPLGVSSIYCDELRADPRLIALIEGGVDKNEHNLKVVEIPDGIQYAVEEYDGVEWIAERHRTWG